MSRVEASMGEEGIMLARSLDHGFASARHASTAGPTLFSHALVKEKKNRKKSSLQRSSVLHG